MIVCNADQDLFVFLSPASLLASAQVLSCAVCVCVLGPLSAVVASCCQPEEGEVKVISVSVHLASAITVLQAVTNISQ